MGKKDNLFTGWKVVLTVLCIVMAVGLVVFLAWNYQMEQMESERLKAVAVMQKAIPEQNEEEEETEEESEPEDEEAEEEPQAEGIACWGDEFFRGEDAEQFSYRVTLQRLLEENGYDLDVANKTLSGASTLSVMKMAGVDQTELDAYIAAHQESADGAQLPVTETGIRDLTEEQMERNDTDYIPVVFMGYYGGWNHDPQELIEQQQKVLDTFGQNKERFVIVGIRPMDGSVTREEYDQAMTEAWGEHYISTTEVMSQNVTTRVAQEEVGTAVYTKLVELGYITKEQE